MTGWEWLQTATDEWLVAREARLAMELERVRAEMDRRV